MKNKKIQKYDKDDLLFVPLGGSGEIGMNCNLYHYQNEWIMVDLGITFKDERAASADIIMPDIDFIIKEKEKLSAIILTHAHEDHIGAMPYLYELLGKVPIYTTSFTASVLSRKFNNKIDLCSRINLLNYNKQISIGSFKIEILALTHSIPEPNAVIIKTKKGNIFHTGDWKIDPTPLVGEAITKEKFLKIKKDGVHALVCDSTNVFNVKESGSENDVRNNFKDVFSKKKSGKIIVTCFASNIARLETIGHVADLYNRSCVLVGRSLKKIYDAAKENNYLNNISDFLSEEEGKVLPDENTVLICTGSQGENRAALYKLVNGNNHNFSLNSDDLIMFSSREIPGNEKQINNLKNQLIKNGCKYIDHNDSLIHVSGHPSKPELRKMYSWVNPEIVIPVHGEYQHLSEHAKFAKKSGIDKTILVENGDMVLLNKDDNSKIIDKVFAGRKALKGNRILSVDKKIFNTIQKINNQGHIIVILILNIEDDLITKPIVSSLTILDEDDIEEKNILIIKIEEFFLETVHNSTNDNILEEQLIKRIRNFTKKQFGIKPIIELKIMRV